MTATATPDRSHQQRAEALERANEIRFARAEVKRGLTRERAAELVATPPDWAQTWKADEFLRSIHRFGAAKAGLWLRRGKISPTKTLGGLTDRQREWLRRELLTDRRWEVAVRQERDEIHRDICRVMAGSQWWGSGEVAFRLGVSSQSAAGRLAVMAKRGLVVRACPGLWSLTEAGHQFFNESREA